MVPLFVKYKIKEMCTFSVREGLRLHGKRDERRRESELRQNGVISLKMRSRSKNRVIIFKKTFLSTFLPVTLPLHP